MDVITHVELRNLVQAGSTPRVSIFMPMHRTGRDVREDPIRLKDLLREAEKSLQEKGADKRTIGRILEPAQAVLEDDAFWADREDGLAFFLADGFSKVFRLPVPVDELARVNDNFYIKPLLAIASEKLFYVLALSQGRSRLLQCTPHRCRQVALPKDVAKSLEEAVGGEEEHQTSTVRHGGDASNPFSAGGAYHGQAQDVQQKEHEDMMFFLRQLDEGVRRVLPDQDVPLVLAGVDSVTPFYRKGSQLRNLFHEEVPGNPEHVQDQELAQKALFLLQPLWHKELNDLQERFGTGISRGLSGRETNEILEAAQTGRVDILFVAAGYAAAGRQEEHPEHIHYGATPAEDLDAVEKAITDTLLNSGTVVPVLREEMPGDCYLSAIYRYPLAEAAAS